MGRFSRGFGLGAAVFAALILVSGSGWGAAYYVAPAGGEGTEDSAQAAVRKLVEETVSESGNDLAPDEDKADFVLAPQLLKLGQVTVMTLSKRTAGPDGRIVFAAKLKAASLEELDGVAARLTLAVIHGSAPDAGDRDDVVAKEQDQVTGPRIESRSSNFIGLGPYALENVGVPARSGDIAYSLDFGRRWEVTPKDAISLNDELSMRSGSYLDALLLGGSHCFGDAATAPFLGLDLGYGAAGNADWTWKEQTFGFAGGARAGILFFRRSTTQMSVQIRHVSVFSTDRYGFPGNTGLEVSVYF